MGKPTGKKKTLTGSKLDNSNPKENKPSERTSKAAVDEDTAVFITMSQELKEEGNRLFQKRDHEGAMLKYEKALKLLPRNHIDVAYLRSNMAACYMQMGIGEYPRAIHECNLALEVAPKYSKALLKRSKCYEALNRLDLALRDVDFVLTMEPNNLTAQEIAEKVKKGLQVDDKEIVLPKDDFVEVKPVHDSSSSRKIVKEKAKKKKKTSTKLTTKKEVVETKAEDKVVVEEEKVVTKTVKLVLGDDIRWAQLPVNCDIRLVRDVVRDRFHGLKGILIKYRDQEGDLVTITTTDELRLAEKSARSHGSLKLHIVEVSPDNEPHYDGMKNADEEREMTDMPLKTVTDNGDLEKGNSCIEDWIVQFARLFKNHVGVESDSCLDLHEIGMKLYSEAMEETVTSEDAQELFEIAASKFQEMTALALFNWGNIHMSGARKRVFFKEDCPDELVSEKLKIAYDWARKEYVKARSKYEEALKIKPDFYEGLLALGQSQFEQAKLCWYYAMGREREVSVSLSSEEVLELYNKAEDSMERGMQMWEEMEEQRLNGLSKTDKYKSELEKLGLLEQFKDIFGDESAEKVEKMKAQIYLLWGTLLYERSVVEFKLGLMSWEECLEVAVEKFELAGASPTDIAVMVKNHCSNETALEGLGFKIDEIVQAWNEMYDFERWQTGVPSFRLEPLFRRRVPKLHSMLEHV